MQLLRKYYWFILLAILAFAFFSRVWRLNIPEFYVFDEVYHALTAKLVAHNDPRAFEWWHGEIEPKTAIDWLHPPLAKYTQAGFMLLFGENSFAWRMSSVVFGTLVILQIAILAKKITGSKPISLLSAALASTDGLLLTQSRIAMNDIHVTFFILLTLIAYVSYLESAGKSQKWLWLTGLSGGLAMASKWSGLFIVGIVLILEMLRLALEVYYHFRFHQKIIVQAKSILISVFVLAVLPWLIYIAGYWQLFTTGHGVSHFIELHRQIWLYQTNLDATHPFQSRPIQWFLDSRPVWFHVTYNEQEQMGNIYNVGNPLLFWIGGVAAMSFTILVFISWLTLVSKSEPKNTFKILALTTLVTAYWLVWVPWQFSPRIMFFYHYTPAVPLMSIIMATIISKLPKKNVIAGLVLTLCLVTFLLWFPHWTGIPVPEFMQSKLYFALATWK